LYKTNPQNYIDDAHPTEAQPIFFSFLVLLYMCLFICLVFFSVISSFFFLYFFCRRTCHQAQIAPHLQVPSLKLWFLYFAVQNHKIHTKSMTFCNCKYPGFFHTIFCMWSTRIIMVFHIYFEA
jgi:hypothetical protein